MKEINEYNVIDCDIAMANHGQVVNVDSKNEYSLHEVLASEVNIEDAINHTSYGLDVILSGVSIVGFLQADMGKLREVARDVVINRVSGVKRELGAKMWRNCSSWIFWAFFSEDKNFDADYRSGCLHCTVCTEGNACGRQRGYTTHALW